MKTKSKNRYNKDSPRIAIIGSGVCGLGIGWRLSQLGYRVDVFESEKIGKGATWAAAGMLAAGVECEPGEEKLLELTTKSQRMWPNFLKDIEKSTNINPHYRDEGTLVIAFNNDELSKLRFNYKFQSRLGIELEWLDKEEVRTLEPHLNSKTLDAVFSKNDHQVDNRFLLLALADAFKNSGGRIHEKHKVKSIKIEKERVKGIVIDSEFHKADIVLLAAGAHSSSIDGLPDSIIPPVRPVKGQMLALQMDINRPLIKHLIWTTNSYLVPRNDGRLIIGATIEESGFNSDITAGALYSLLESAWRTLPTIEELPVVETWCGFRPTSRDDAPILGPTEIEGLVLATGHHRNGILLAPLTADTISEYISTGNIPPEIEDYNIDRFLN